MYLPNMLADAGGALDPADATAFGAGAAAAAEALFAVTHGEGPTPLVELPGLAAASGLGALLVKDESGRHGLGSFKALGGAHAAIRLALDEAGRRTGRRFGPEDLGTPDLLAVTRTLTMACATDGNHGRSVAAGARLVGARAVVFLHQGVREVRADAIRAEGARIVRVAGDYDDSLAAVARSCAAEGWINVSDMALPGQERIPTLVMQGYTVMAAEILRQCGDRMPTHLFLQAGVGGMAAAVAAHLAMAGPDRPRLVVVEPDGAACLLESARAGRRLQLASHAPTVMALLECREPSATGWRILSRLARDFMAVPDTAARAAVNRLARPVAGDPALVVGESGAAGLAGLFQAVADPGLQAALGLGPAARVLVIATEGANDVDAWSLSTGLVPEDVKRVGALKRAG
ncbi:diaminopropionate ammonia-lyase [Tistrella mobilis]|uniref:diaminopropionate ammonia-lyase n=1 Tax=Tistrella mobilis TaxID=171437 RepID=UPI0035573AA3